MSLDDPRSVERNRQRLWQGLLVSDPRHVCARKRKSQSDPVVRGWLTLGSLATATGQQGIGWSNGVVRWRNQNTGHPAMSIVEDLQIPEDQLLEYPRNIALLLPLSGRTAGAGKAIQNGFLGAYFASAGGLDDRQSIRIYDVNSEGGPGAAYMAAVEDGAEFVVGPLLRNNVSALANDILVPVPVLTLNYLPDETLPPPGLFQFALAPEDEAVSAAIRAIGDGHRNGVALVPNNSWGRRVLTSFSTEFERQGGTLLDYRSFTTASPDFSRTIEELMGLAGSFNRYQRLAGKYRQSATIRSASPARRRLHFSCGRRRGRPTAEVAAQVPLLGGPARVFDLVDLCDGRPVKFRPQRHFVSQTHRGSFRRRAGFVICPRSIANTGPRRSASRDCMRWATTLTTWLPRCLRAAAA